VYPVIVEGVAAVWNVVDLASMKLRPYTFVRRYPRCAAAFRSTINTTPISASAR
jgi:hypothetical protein